MIRAKGIVDGTQWEYSHDIDQTYPARVQASAGETISRGRWGLNWPIVSHTANYKNTTLFRNIFTPIFQKYHTGDLRTPDAGRISPIAALEA